MIWRHLVIGSRNSWHHGDERGFRSRRHRIHSSGDYKQRPPGEEHIRLRRFQAEQSADPVQFDLRTRVLICQQFVLKMRSIGIRIIACSVAERHLHALAELPDAYADAIKIVGRCKQKASHAVRDRLPGAIWTDGGSFKRIRGVPHLHSTYKYIRTRQEIGAIVWSHNDQENWIDNESLDIVIMMGRKTQGRLARPQAGV